MTRKTVPSMIDDTKRLLITAGAAVAANGAELAKKSVVALRRADVPEEKTAMALSIGRCVRERPAAHMMSVADVLVETGYSKEGDADCNAADTASGALCQKTVLLVSAGAAMAANCEPCLNTLVPRLMEIGVSTDDIRTAVVIGKETQDAIAGDTWIAVTAALGDKDALEAPPCGCGEDACCS